MTSVKDKTRLEKVVEETARPLVGALKQLRLDIRQTMGISDAPWNILNKTYTELTVEELQLLFQIYHTEGELEPCPMCVWSLRRELQELNKPEAEK